MWDFIVKYKWIILGIIILIILFIIARRKGWFSSKKPFDKVEPALPGAGAYTSPLTGTTCNQKASFPLELGSKGKQVGALQNFLNNLPGVPDKNKLKVDCIFGEKTRNAVNDVWDEVYNGSNKDYINLSDYVTYNMKVYE